MEYSYSMWIVLFILKNHKRVYRVYCNLNLNQKRCAKKRILPRTRQPLFVPKRPNQIWSADFMGDFLYAGKRFRTFNVLDDFFTGKY
jgi:putative transposase